MKEEPVCSCSNSVAVRPVGGVYAYAVGRGLCVFVIVGRGLNTGGRALSGCFLITVILD